MKRDFKRWAQAALAACALGTLYPSSAFGQPDTLWTRGIVNFGSNLQVIRTTDNGYAIGGSGGNRRNDGLADADFNISKLDSLCGLQWECLYSGIPGGHHVADNGFAICQTPDGGYILSGRTSGAVAVIRTDAGGDTLWMRYYRTRDGFETPGNGEMGVIVSQDGNIAFVSRHQVVKVADEDGEVIWRQTYAETATRILPTDEGGFFLAGYSGMWLDFYAARIDEEGEVIWEETYFTDNDRGEGCFTALSVSGGGWLLGGSSRYSPDYGDINPSLARISEEGELLWYQIYEDRRGTVVQEIVETSDGGFAFTAKTAGGGYLLMRVDYAGEQLWHTGFGQIGDEACSIILMDDGGYLIGGYGEGSGFGCWLVRTEPDTTDLPFELEAATDSYDFGGVTVDSVGTWELAVTNNGRRFAVIDSLWFEGDASAFACLADLPLRIYPTDTTFIPISFQPPDDTTYSAILRFWYGDDQTVEVALSGRGLPTNAVSDFILQPSAFSLSVYPNPFNNAVRIDYVLPEASNVKLSVYDVAGHEIAVLFSGNSRAGAHQQYWQSGGAATGLYLLRLQSGNAVCTRKVMLIK